jgi:putative acetyltransferase
LKINIFSPVSTTPPSDPNGIGIAPVAVRPDVQSRGIGSLLIRAGLRLCKDPGYDYCVVLGSPENYQRFGFEEPSPFGIRNEYGVDDEFMILLFADRGVAGPIRCALEFAVFSI